MLYTLKILNHFQYLYGGKLWCAHSEKQNTVLMSTYCRVKSSNIWFWYVYFVCPFSWEVQPDRQNWRFSCCLNVIVSFTIDVLIKVILWLKFFYILACPKKAILIDKTWFFTLFLSSICSFRQQIQPSILSISAHYKVFHCFW